MLVYIVYIWFHSSSFMIACEITYLIILLLLIAFYLKINKIHLFMEALTIHDQGTSHFVGLFQEISFYYFINL